MFNVHILDRYEEITLQHSNIYSHHKFNIFNIAYSCYSLRYLPDLKIVWQSGKYVH